VTAGPRSRLLILAASVGGGHLAAARAVAAAAGARGVETRVIDVLDHLPEAARTAIPRAYFGLARHAPDLVALVGRRFQDRTEPGHHGDAQRALVAAVGGSLLRAVDAWRPATILHTHYFGLQLLDPPRQVRPPVHVVAVTDHALHRFWLHPAIRRYYLADAGLAGRAQALGIAPDRLRSSGIPVDPRFEAPPSRTEARAALGVDPLAPLVLLMAGGLTRSSAEALVRGLAALDRPLEVAVVTGRSPELARALPGHVPRSGRVRFRWLGRTDAVPSWMAAADVVVGKPGGLTLSEALACGRPFVAVDPYPLQEEANARFLLRTGGGACAVGVSAAASLVRELLDDPGRRLAMAEGAGAAGRPRAAVALIDDLFAAGWLVAPGGMAAAA